MSRFCTTEEALDDLRAGRMVVVVDAEECDNDDELRFCAEHGLKMVTLADLAGHRRRRESVVERVVETALPTRYGDFRIAGYRSRGDNHEHIALVMGEVAGAPDVLVHVHSQCQAGDALDSLLCSCGDQLREALARISAEGRGVVVYLAQKTRGVAAGILADVGPSSIRLLTDSPAQAKQLGGHGVHVTKHVPIGPSRGACSPRRAHTMARPLGHLFTTSEARA